MSIFYVGIDTEKKVVTVKDYETKQEYLFTPGQARDIASKLMDCALLCELQLDNKDLRNDR